MIRKLVFSLLLLSSAALIALNFYKSSPIDFPPPVNTTVIKIDDNHDLKQQWINQLHLSAPEDNWRKMDMDFRLKKAKDIKQNSSHRQEVVYGKWEELGSNNQAGRTLVAEFDQEQNKLYVASDGGQIWVGTPEEEDWISLTDHIKISGIHFLRKIDMGDFNRLLVGSGQANISGFLYSDDEGQTLHYAEGLSSIENWGFVRRVVMGENPDLGIYLLSHEWDYNNGQPKAVIYKSMDRGESFEEVTSFPYNATKVDLWTNRYDNNSIYLFANETFYLLKPTNEIVELSHLNTSEFSTLILTGAIIEGTEYFYAMLRNNNQSIFFTSVDGGINWTQTGILSEGPFLINSFVASPITEGLVYFGGVNAYRSSNYGETWQIVNQWYEYYDSPEDKLHADIPSFCPFINNQNDEMVFINTDGGIYVSEDQLENVENLSMSNLRISQYYSSYTCRFDPQFTHAGSQDQGYQFSNNGENLTIDYEQVISGDYGHIVSGDEGASVWMVYPGFAMYNTSPNTNHNLKTWDFVGSNYQWMPRLMADPNDPASVYIAGGRITSGARLIHVTYASNQMIYSEGDFDFSNGTGANISALAYSPINTDYFYVLTSEKDFFYSTDMGFSWIQTEGFNGPESHYFYGATIAPSKTNLGLIYVGGSGYSNPPVFVSEDNGVTFSSFAEGLPNTLVFQLALSSDDSLLFAATQIGAYVCKTWEGQWYDIGDSILPIQDFWSVEYIDLIKTARFASYGRGIWDLNMNPDVEADFLADQIEIHEGEMIGFIDLSQWNPISWEWTFDGGSPMSSNEQSPGGVLYEEAGNFDVKLIVNNDHSVDTLIKENYINVLPISSIEPEASNISYDIFPNPATEKVFIRSNENISLIELFTIGGSLVKSQHGDMDNLINIIDLSDVPKGLCFIRINYNDKTIIEKIIIQ